MKTACVLVAALAIAAPAAAQTGAAQTPANPLTAAMKSSYDLIKGNITKSAEKVSEEHYSFKPSPDVRTFGQIECGAQGEHREDEDDEGRPAEGARGFVQRLRRGLCRDD